jgi:hypothetical protein
MEGESRLDALARDLASGRISRRTALRRFLGGAAGLALPSVLIAEPALARCPRSRKCGSKCCPAGQHCKHGKCKCKGGLTKCGKQCCRADERCVDGKCASETAGAVCGNNVAEIGEQCDGTDLRSATCATVGFGSGTLRCGADCRYDTSGCTPPVVCGNGVKEDGEVCDGGDLGGATCQSLGFVSGTLACNANCQSFDTSGCVMPQCSTVSECPGTDTECRTRTCVSGTCGFSFAAAGTVLGAQTAGDCKKDVCDGAGGVVQANDDSDTPPSGACTHGGCANGVPTQTPANEGTACPGGTCSSGVCGCTTCPNQGNPCTVGIGACQRTGTIICDGNCNSVCSATPGAPQPERCNNIDDDCDGVVDNGFPNKGQPCDDGGVGICRGTGTYVCSPDGTGVICNITVPGQPARMEICGNGLDDDCDGVVDNGCP